MTGRWGNKTFQSNTSLHLGMDSKLPVATLLVVSVKQNLAKTKRREVKERRKMKHEFACPHCQWVLGIPEKLVGQTINCPACNEQIQLPEKGFNNQSTSQTKSLGSLSLNRVERISLSDGIIGRMLTDPRNAIEEKCLELNAEGWICHQIIPHASNNTLIALLRGVILICTLFMWTFGDGYLLLFEKEGRR